MFAKYTADDDDVQTQTHSQTPSTQTDTSHDDSCHCVHCHNDEWAQPLDRSQTTELRSIDNEAQSAVSGVTESTTSAETGWLDSDSGDILSGRDAEDRAFALHEDRQHPANHEYEFSTERGTESAHQRRLTTALNQAVAQFDHECLVPTGISQSTVVDRALRISVSNRGLETYGGTKFTALIALAEVCNWSNEALFRSDIDGFKSAMTEVVLCNNDVSYSKAFRRFCEVRNEVFGQ